MNKQSLYRHGFDILKLETFCKRGNAGLTLFSLLNSTTQVTFGLKQFWKQPHRPRSPCQNNVHCHVRFYKDLTKSCALQQCNVQNKIPYTPLHCMYTTVCSPKQTWFRMLNIYIQKAGRVFFQLNSNNVSRSICCTKKHKGMRLFIALRANKSTRIRLRFIDLLKHFQHFIEWFSIQQNQNWHTQTHTHTPTHPYTAEKNKEEKINKRRETGKKYYWFGICATQLSFYNVFHF